MNTEGYAVNYAAGHAVGLAAVLDAPFGANMPSARQLGPDPALDRLSNNKKLEIGQSQALKSFAQSSEALQAHKDDYQHWTNV